jgi:hypothetical protein
MCSNTVATKSGIIVESPNYVSRSFGLDIMISHITDLKISLYSSAISASAAFVQREASIYGTFFALCLPWGARLREYVADSCRKGGQNAFQPQTTTLAPEFLS